MKSSDRMFMRVIQWSSLVATLAIVITGLFMAGCSSNDHGSNPTDGGGTVKMDPSFANDIQEIFNRRGCSGSSCHGSSMQAGLDLRTGNSFNSLVNVSSSETPLLRVKPNDPDSSYLIMKVEGNQTVGDRMPLNLPPLDATDLQKLRDWIAQGAKQN